MRRRAILKDAAGHSRRRSRDALSAPFSLIGISVHLNLWPPRTFTYPKRGKKPLYSVSTCA